MTDKDNRIDNVVGSLMRGMEGALSAKTVVGEPTVVGDMTIIPLVDVSFGMGAGAGMNGGRSSSSGGGGIGGKMTPSAVLIVNKNGSTKLVNIKNQDTVTKILDMIPDVIDKFTAKKEEMPADQEAVDIAFPGGDAGELEIEE